MRLFNFSKKLACILLILCLSISLIACGESADDSDEKATEQTEANSGKEVEPEKPVEIRYLLPHDAGVEFNSDTWSIKEWGERTNVIFNIEPLPRDVFNEKIAAVLASGKLPDLINWFKDETTETYKKYGSKLFVALDDYMDQMPNLKKVLDKYPDISDRMIHPTDGKLYGFPRLSENVTFTPAMYVRNDLLKEAGLDAADIKTIDDFKEAMLALRDTIGKDYITSCRLGFSYFSNTAAYFGADWEMVYDNKRPDGTNKYVFGPTLPEYRTWVETMKWMYENKLLHPNFLVMQAQELNAGHIDGSFPLMIQQLTSFLGLYEDADMSKEQSREVSLIGMLQTDGTYKRVALNSVLSIGYRWPVTINKDSGTEVIEACVRALDYVYSEEGAILLSRGEEGTHWVKDSESPSGIKITGYQDSSNKEELGAAKWNTLPTRAQLGIGYSWIYPYTLPVENPFWNRVNDMVEEWTDNGWVVQPEPYVNLTEEENNRKAEIKTALDTYVEENTVKFIVGQKPMSEWDSFINGLEKLKVNELVDMYNK